MNKKRCSHCYFLIQRGAKKHTSIFPRNYLLSKSVDPQKTVKRKLEKWSVSQSHRWANGFLEAGLDECFGFQGTISITRNRQVNGLFDKKLQAHVFQHLQVEPLNCVVILCSLERILAFDEFSCGF